jgi:Domain of Unknown Function (DUF930)
MKISVIVAMVLTGLGSGGALAKADKTPPSNKQTRETQMLLKLTPETRMEQRCDSRAMGALNREHTHFRSDELVAYAFSDPVIQGDVMRAPGAAVRSGNAWYHLSYVCETSEQGLEIKSFSYTLGAAVPRPEWDKHYLVPQ